MLHHSPVIATNHPPGLTNLVDTKEPSGSTWSGASLSEVACPDQVFSLPGCLVAPGSSLVSGYSSPEPGSSSFSPGAAGGSYRTDYDPSLEFDSQPPWPTDEDFPDDLALRGEDVGYEPAEDCVQLETRGTTRQRQTELWRTSTLFKETLLYKLRSLGRDDLATALEICHTERGYVRCGGCGVTRETWNRCERFYCPECQPRLSKDRRRAVEWWTRTIPQPKHVVLTSRNSSAIDQARVRAFKKAFNRLRHSKICRAWRGGFYSLEVTNEGRGWHLHLHALVDARWVDARELARVWARCVGQDFAIVKVKDARGQDYLRELTKYAVKGSQLAEWPAQDCAAFIDAFTGQRTFGCFGSLYKQRAEFRDAIKDLQALARVCECGCSQWKHFKEWELEIDPRNHDDGRLQDSPRPPPDNQLTLSCELDALRLAALAR